MVSKVYNIPAGCPVQDTWKYVILRAPCVSTLVQEYERLKNKSIAVSRLILTIPKEGAKDRFNIDSDFAEIERLPREIELEIHITESDINPLYLWRVVLSHFPINIVIQLHGEIHKHVKMLTKIGYPVKLPYDAFCEKNRRSMLKIYDYYFHKQKLSLAIEPIRTLFKAWLRGSSKSIVDFYTKDSEGRFIVDVGLSMDDRNDPCSSHFTFSDSIEAPDKDEPLPLTEDCRACRAYRICGGCLKEARFTPIPFDCSVPKDLVDTFALKLKRIF